MTTADPLTVIQTPVIRSENAVPMRWLFAAFLPDDHRSTAIRNRRALLSMQYDHVQITSIFLAAMSSGGIRKISQSQASQPS